MLIGMKAPRILKFIDMNKGDNKDTDTYNNYTLKIDIRWNILIQNIWFKFILSVI